MLAAVLLSLSLLHLPAPPTGSGVCRPAPAAPALPGALRRVPDPFAIALAPTPHANGAWGQARLRFAASPFGVAVTAEGRHVYQLELHTRGLQPPPGTVAVVWAATPELDRVERLGALDPGGRLVGRVAFNKFLLFVTAEPSADVERWSGPILLRGISRSGMLHTMAGHGPFEGEPC